MNSLAGAGLDVRVDVLKSYSSMQIRSSLPGPLTRVRRNRGHAVKMDRFALSMPAGAR